MDAVAREVVRSNDTGLLRGGEKVDAQRSSKVGRFLCDARLAHRPRFTGFQLIAGLAAGSVEARKAFQNKSNQSFEINPSRLGGV